MTYNFRQVRLDTLKDWLWSLPIRWKHIRLMRYCKSFQKMRYHELAFVASWNGTLGVLFLNTNSKCYSLFAFHFAERLFFVWTTYMPQENAFSGWFVGKQWRKGTATGLSVLVLQIGDTLKFNSRAARLSQNYEFSQLAVIIIIETSLGQNKTFYLFGMDCICTNCHLFVKQYDNHKGMKRTTEIIHIYIIIWSVVNVKGTPERRMSAGLQSLNWMKLREEIFPLGVEDLHGEQDV